MNCPNCGEVLSESLNNPQVTGFLRLNVFDEYICYNRDCYITKIRVWNKWSA